MSEKDKALKKALQEESVKGKIKSLIIFLYCHGFLSANLTDKLFNKFKLGGV